MPGHNETGREVGCVAVVVIELGSSAQDRIWMEDVGKVRCHWRKMLVDVAGEDTGAHRGPSRGAEMDCVWRASKDSWDHNGGEGADGRVIKQEERRVEWTEVCLSVSRQGGKERRELLEKRGDRRSQ